VVADELVRVSAPGGAIALVNWTPEGMIGRLLRTVGRHLPPPPDFASPPPLWGDEAHVRALFTGHDVDLRFERARNAFRFPSAEAFTTFFVERYGPLIKAREKLEPTGAWAACHAEIAELFAAADEAGDGTYGARAEYLVVTARRRG
jgi:hypothetical protein